MIGALLTLRGEDVDDALLAIARRGVPAERRLVLPTLVKAGSAEAVTLAIELATRGSRQDLLQPFGRSGVVDIGFVPAHGQPQQRLQRLPEAEGCREFGGNGFSDAIIRQNAVHIVVQRLRRGANLDHHVEHHPLGMAPLFLKRADINIDNVIAQRNPIARIRPGRGDRTLFRMGKGKADIAGHFAPRKAITSASTIVPDAPCP